MKNYCIDEKNFLCHELIGLKARVHESPDASKKKIFGKIVNETMNTLTIETKDGEKIVPKKEVVLKLSLPNKKTVLVEGKNIVFRPEDRIKALAGRK
jgi:ribonuclease P protein subunit POP4